MITVDVNLDKFNLKPSDLVAPAVADAARSALQTTLAVVKDRWQSEAQQKLHSTLPLYLMGLDFNSVIYPLNGDSFSGAVELHGKLPNMLEKGFSAFDMKTGFKNSPRATHTQSGGWYLTIPIRHSTPGAFMYGKPMPKDIYTQAKKLKNGKSLAVPGAGAKSWTGYQHKSSIYDGLTRIVKSYSGGTKQSQYLTFRRVSDKSDPQSWMHPGYIGAKIAEDLQPYAATTLSKVLERNLAAL